MLAVLIDAVIVRMLLVPATMAILGRAAWWAPRFLGGRPPVPPLRTPATRSRSRRPPPG
ncbi:hypothetical protein V2I01_12065 [Micromonospora sp. BRA006-A]|nr:hypothetical protein [Micromonospora sp. BRA006-A]